MIEAGTRLRLASAALSAGLLLAACGVDSGPTAEAPPAAQEPGRPAPGGPRLVVLTDGGPVVIRVEVADTPEERSRGLMGRTELPEDAGMVFLPDGATSSSGFWMKDTLIPLTVAFWDPSGTIRAIIDMEPCEADPCPVYDPGLEWAGAVEVNQGFLRRAGVEVGDTVRLEG